MAHAGTTMDLGRSRPGTKETQKGSGWSRTPLAVALAVALGLVVGLAAWAVAGSLTTSNTQPAPFAAALHEKIEAHQAAMAAQADRAYDPIEAHRTASATVAAVATGRRGYDEIEAHRTAAANAAVDRGYDPIAEHRKGSVVAEPADHRLDAIETQGGLPVRPDPVDTPSGPRPLP